MLVLFTHLLTRSHKKGNIHLTFVGTQDKMCTILKEHSHINPLLNTVCVSVCSSVLFSCFVITIRISIHIQSAQFCSNNSLPYCRNDQTQFTLDDAVHTWLNLSDLSCSFVVLLTMTQKTWTQRISTARWKVSLRRSRTLASAARRTWTSPSNGEKEKRWVDEPELCCQMCSRVYGNLYLQTALVWYNIYLLRLTDISRAKTFYRAVRLANPVT